MKNVISIEVVNGGFVLTHPLQDGNTDAITGDSYSREVFTSPRKLIQKIKSVLDTVSTIADDSESSK